MKSFLVLRGVRRLLEQCATIKSGEKAVVVTDTDLVELADIVAGALDEFDTDVVYTVMKPREFDGSEPPAAVGAALREADVAILLVTKSINHTPAISNALASGTRILSMAGFTADMFNSRAISTDFHAMRPVCERVAEMLTNTKTATLTTPAGTNITFNLEGRSGNSHACIVDKPGMYSGVPNIEANIAPVEGECEGTIVFDGSIPNLRTGTLSEPVTLKVEKGSIVSISGGREASMIESIWSEHDDANVYNIAQLAVGLNPNCIPFTGDLMNDHGAYGTVHIGIGTSENLGGDVRAPLHFDGMMYRPTLLLDDHTLLKEGDLTI
jgi:2,5-dihydroxypyridine 5,6-dioxygenase